MTRFQPYLSLSGLWIRPNLEMQEVSMWARLQYIKITAQGALEPMCTEHVLSTHDTDPTLRST